MMLRIFIGALVILMSLNNGVFSEENSKYNDYFKICYEKTLLFEILGFYF